MTPEELATHLPQLYHVTEPGAWSNIKQNGLLSTSCLLDLFEIKGLQRTLIETKRRPQPIPLEHPHQAQVIINDNVPLIEQALSKCLDDGLTPADWLCTLNARVFFWPDEEALNRILNARLNRHRAREVIVVDTLSLAKVHAERMELCPINSGSTIRKPARRGLATFTPMLKYSFGEWSQLRGRRDHIREVTIRDKVVDIAQHTIDVFQTRGALTI